MYIIHKKSDKFLIYFLETISLIVLNFIIPLNLSYKLIFLESNTILIYIIYLFNYKIFSLFTTGYLYLHNLFQISLFSILIIIRIKQYFMLSFILPLIISFKSIFLIYIVKVLSYSIYLKYVLSQYRFLTLSYYYALIILYKNFNFTKLIHLITFL